MKLRPAFAMAAIALFTTLTACGSASDGITFAAPPGWTSKMSMLSFMTAYESPDKTQMLMLMKLPFQSNDFTSATKQGSAKNVTLTQKSQIKICGNQDALFASGTGDIQTINEAKDSAQNKPTKKDNDRMDMVVTAVNGATYLAMYVRPITMAADKTAEGAIHNLCPKT